MSLADRHDHDRTTVPAAWRAGFDWDTPTVIGIVATTGATLLVPLFRVRFLVMPARRVSSAP